VFPRLRLGGYWFNLLWMVPITLVSLLILVGLADLLRLFAPVQQFIAQYPGPVPNSAEPGFPWWLRWQHFLNALFLIPIARSGIQHFGNRPRVYWQRRAERGREWLRIQKAVTHPTWPIREDSVALPQLVGLPGERRSPLARWWHLGVSLLWVINGIVFYVLIFVTDQWQRIVPTSWDVFPNALSATIQYASLNFPPNEAWVEYNGMQLLTYFVTVFVAAPLAVITGILHSPSLAKRLPKWPILSAEIIRSVHLLTLAWFIGFVIVHVALVLLTGALLNLNTMTIGTNDTGWTGLILFAVFVVVVAGFWAALSPVTRAFPKRVQRVWQAVLGPLARFF
jgi:methionine sulfoxide reductase catalytic subunit